MPPDPKNEPFKPTMRLTCQCSIPVENKSDAEAWYNELKIFLLAFSPDVTLNGQVMMMLEPCCKKPIISEGSKTPTNRR
jgi:hypothetical protein